MNTEYDIDDPIFETFFKEAACWIEADTTDDFEWVD
jgi:hypothetical protein